jgi:hypothetical protein
MLMELGFKHSQSAPGNLVAERKIAGLAALDADADDTGPRCIVCQEGYLFKQKQIMGVYVFNKYANRDHLLFFFFSLFPLCLDCSLISTLWFLL